MPLAAGARLGGYDVVGLLGAGGMGEVYAARDRRLGRSVAVKVVREEVASEIGRVQRLEREARALASVNHPHIAALYGFDEADGRKFLVMELVEGETLADRLRRGPLPVEQALRIARQIAEALEAAHEKGVVHRDLKPANVKLTPDNNVKVLDFGLAKAMETDRGAASQNDSPTLSVTATQAGLIVGTAAYMAPEQAKGLSTDHRSDVFSFGVVMFEMLTGRQPFQGETAADVLASVLAHDPDLSTFPSDLNPRLTDLVRRCLEKSPRRRWQAIGDVRSEIETLAAAPRLTAAGNLGPSRPLWRRALATAAIAIVSAVAAGVAVWYLRPAPDARIVRFSFPLAEELTTPARYSIAISPDGRLLAYAAGNRLHLRAMEDLSSKPLPGTDGFDSVHSPVFSPDGQSIVFWAFRGQSLKRISLSGGSAVSLCPAVSPFGISWGPDGIVVGQGSEGIIRVSADGGKPEQLVTMNPGEYAHSPQVLPDGDHVLFTLSVGADQWDGARVVVQSTKTGERKTVIDSGNDARYLSSGHLVYALGGSLHAIAFDVRSLSTRGGPVPVLDGVRRGSSSLSATAHYSVSASGSLVYVPGLLTEQTSARRIVLIDRSGTIQPLKLPPDVYEYPRVSPDGRQIAYTNHVGKEWVVWLYDLSESSATRRLTYGGNNRFPVWSPDGRHVAFQSDREGDFGIWWQAADHTGTATRLTRPEAGVSHMPDAFARNGTLLFTSLKGLEFSLWTLSPQDKTPVPFGDVRAPIPPGAASSPDGRWVAYASGTTPSSTVYVQPFPPTGEIHALPAQRSDVPHQPVWTRDGKAILYNPRPGSLEIIAVNTTPSFTFGEAVNLPRPFSFAAGPPLARRPFDLTASGQLLRALSQEELEGGATDTPQANVVLNWFEELRRRVPVAGR
jgi:serine/threonine-protein kinase